jgi:hypothetical protein
VIDLLSDNRAVISVIIGTVFIVAWWFVRRHLMRIDALDKDAVRRHDLHEMRAERERLHQENASKLEAINATVQATYKSIADIGVLSHRILISEQLIQELRDFKHEHVDPAVRYVEYLKHEKPWEEAVAKVENSSAATLVRIENKIDAYEERDSKTRHDIRDSMNAVAMKVAVLETRLPEKK